MTLSFRPQLEELNGRLVPSTTAIVPPSSGVEQIHVMPPTHHPLYGATQGSLFQSSGAGSVQSYEFSGQITLAGLGHFQVSGWLQGPGAEAGRATGQLNLTNSYGTLTVELHSGILPAGSPIPSEVVYSIRGGTGVYAQTRGYGVADFAFAPAPAPGAATDSPSGTFHVNLY